MEAENYYNAIKPEGMEQAVHDLTEKIRALLRKGERVLICFDDSPCSLGSALKQAVEACQAVPVIWDPDHRWKTLFRQAFSERVSAVIGDPMLVLGLSKLTRAYGTSLKIHTAVIVGGHGNQWLAEDIGVYLDCKVHRISCTEDTREDTLIGLERELLSWTSILDCRLAKSAAGLELEIVAFSGERMPRLPSCAKLVVKPWNAETDVPFCIAADWKNG